MADIQPPPPPETSAQETDAKVEKLPKLTAAEFRNYNHMAEHMEYYHNNFRQSWNTLYNACLANTRPSSLSLRQFLQTGLTFCSHLTLHHDIEEAHIFPVLARKMPLFRDDLQMKSQHKEIHTGLVVLEKYLGECMGGERELVLKELKGVMDGFGGVLWQHLGDEVEQLGAENMRLFWTMEEMRRMPM